MDAFMTVSRPAATLPSAPPPARYIGTRTLAFFGGTAPWCRIVPFCNRTAGPNTTSPAVSSSTKWRSVGPLDAKFGRSVHVCHSPSSKTSTTSGCSAATTGARRSLNRAPATPSDSPRYSFRISSAFVASAVPPIVKHVSPRISGDAL
jgi:hypothetical protein